MRLAAPARAPRAGWGMTTVPRFVRAGFVAIVTAISMLGWAKPTLATDETRRRVINEACPTFERDDFGANGVMSPREVRCRLAMGESYDEIAIDISDRQKWQAAQQQSIAEARRGARERASQAHNAAMATASELCLQLVEDHKQGRWFASGARAPALLLAPDDAGPDISQTIVETVARQMDGLGHNFGDADERAFALAHPQAGRLEQLESMLDAIAGNIRTHAQRAQNYEQFQRNAQGPIVRPPSAKDYAFACFLQQQFGSVNVDPWNRSRP